MAQTPDINAPQSGLIVAVNQVATDINAPQSGLIVAVNKVATDMKAVQSGAFGVYNVPADSIKATYAGANIPYTRISQQMKATSAGVIVVTRGKIDNPKLVSWWYTLDGHDYFVLKLGTAGKTLVYDLSTQQWSWWSSDDDIRWRASTGMNWRSSGNIPKLYGTNVIVGDDSAGILWVLNPEQGMDEKFYSDGFVTFPRVATGQMTVRGRVSLPIYSVYLTASLGDPSYELSSVTFEYSDDQGHTYIEADEPQSVASGSYDQEFVWRSLGQVRAPGRLFRITDDGAFARIDSLDVNANEGA